MSGDADVARKMQHWPTLGGRRAMVPGAVGDSQEERRTMTSEVFREASVSERRLAF